MRTAIAPVSPANPSIRLGPGDLRRGGDEGMGAEWVAVVDQLRGVAGMGVEPLREEQVGGHVVVDQALSEDSDPAAGGERDRDDQGGADDDDEGADTERSETVAAAHQRPDGDGSAIPAAIAAVTASPGSFTAIPQTTSSTDSPTAGASAEARGRPLASITAWPHASAAAVITTPERIGPEHRRGRLGPVSALPGQVSGGRSI